VSHQRALREKAPIDVATANTLIFPFGSFVWMISPPRSHDVVQVRSLAGTPSADVFDSGEVLTRVAEALGSHVKAGEGCGRH